MKYTLMNRPFGLGEGRLKERKWPKDLHVISLYFHAGLRFGNRDEEKWEEVEGQGERGGGEEGAEAEGKKGKRERECKEREKTFRVPLIFSQNHQALISMITPQPPTPMTLQPVNILVCVGLLAPRPLQVRILNKSPTYYDWPIRGPGRYAKTSRKLNV